MGKFSINDVNYDSHLSELTQQGDAVKLDPRLASLLDYFIENPNLIISRDQLLENVWKGAVVSDNTVSWSVSQLRKLLGDDTSAPRFILTVPKKGYRFIAKVSPLEPDQGRLPEVGSEDAQVKLANNGATGAGWLAKAKWPAILGGALLLLVALNAVVTPPVEYHLTPGTLLTSMDGVERGGEISPDGVMLVFRHKSAATDDRYRLYFKPLIDTASFAETLPDGSVSPRRLEAGRDQPAFPIAGLPADVDYTDVVWGKDSYQLYAVESGQQRCRIVEINLEVNRQRALQKREITTCNQQGLTKLAFNQSTILFTDAREGNRYQLFSMAFDTGDINPLTHPSTNGGGDRFIDVYGHGQKVLILRNIDWKQTAFVEFNLASAEERTLLTLNSIYYSAYWGPDGNDIWLNWGNDTVLRYDIASETSFTLLQSGFGWNFDTHPVQGKGGIFTVSDGNASDFLEFDGEAFTKNRTRHTERLPVYSPVTGTLAYVSNQSGIPQIWLKTSDGEAEQLSNLKEYREFHYLFWSDDEQWLVGNSQDQIGALDLKDEVFHILYQGPLSPHFPGLSSDKKALTFAAKNESTWFLYLVNDPGPDSKAIRLTEGVRHQWWSEGGVLFTKDGLPGLFHYDLSSRQKKLVMPELPAGVSWLVKGEHVYFRHPDNEQRLMRTPMINFRPEEVLSLPQNIGRFTLHPDGSRWIFEDWRQSQTDLKYSDIVFE